MTVTACITPLLTPGEGMLVGVFASAPAWVALGRWSQLLLWRRSWRRQYLRSLSRPVALGPEYGKAAPEGTTSPLLYRSSSGTCAPPGLEPGPLEAGASLYAHAGQYVVPRSLPGWSVEPPGQFKQVR